jgi:DNA (cytosine-5)-methyltransferase 1
MTHGSLFSGIGGFDLAAQWMGWENKFHCEWNEFGQKVLHHYWPDAELFTDITKSNFTKYHGTIDIISGGFPCQPYSMAGKRLGKEDDRHLWPEMLRVIREVRPSWVVGENVLGLVNWNGGLVFHEVQTDLEAEGYEVQPFVLPAAGVGAPHRRDRVFFVSRRNAADTHGIRLEQCKDSGQMARGQGEMGRQGGEFTDAVKADGKVADAANSNRKVLEHRNGKGEAQRSAKPEKRTKSFNSPRDWEGFPTQSPICSRNDGLPDKLDGITFSKWRNESIKAYGNAVVPQVVYQIFKTIQEYENKYL